MKELRITLVKSTIGSKPQHRLTVKALGLRKLNHHVVKGDNPAIRGMVDSVRHLVTVTEV
jgi:large subunit ribosomal protein L30